MSTLGTILKDNWEWRSQICRLAVFDLQKQSRGAVLSWAWLIIKPLTYLFCFWFALDVGLRAAREVPDPGGTPYILWLAAGIVPWFFMQKMLASGADVLHRYPYLVRKIKFPISAISSIYTLAQMIVHLMLQAILLGIYFFCGQGLDIHLLQVPVLIVLMFLFWDVFSIGISQLTALSKDVKNLIAALSTPFFWLSGVIFDITAIPFDWVHTCLYFNPITSFVTAFRDVLYLKMWVWEDPMLCIGFGIVFLVTLVFAIFTYSRFSEEVSDAL